MNANVIETMRKLAAPLAADPMERRSRLAGPYFIGPIGGAGDWRCATDARSMLWVNGVGSAIVSMPIPNEYVRPLLTQFFTPKKISGECQATVGALKAFCGPPCWEVPCPAACGAITLCDCCDGAGTVSPPPRYGYLLGRAFDRIRLANLLEPMRDDCIIRVLTDTMCAIHVHHELFRVICMQMSPSGKHCVPDGAGNTWETAPHFLVEVAP